MTTDCVHHYLLGDSAGGFTVGRCRECGAERSWKSVYDPVQSFNVNLMRDPLLSRVEGTYRLTYGEAW